MQLYEFGCIDPTAYPNNGVNQEIKRKKTESALRKRPTLLWYSSRLKFHIISKMIYNLLSIRY